MTALAKRSRGKKGWVVFKLFTTLYMNYRTGIFERKNNKIANQSDVERNTLPIPFVHFAIKDNKSCGPIPRYK